MRRFFVMPLFVCAATTLFASTVAYDNGAPNQQNGNEMTNWIQSNDFTLAQNTTIGGVNFWTIESGTSAYSGSIYYGIYADNGGQPNLSAPVVEGFLQGTNVVRSLTGVTVLDSYNEYAYSFNIQPFVALAGETYWLGLHNGDLSNAARVNMYWESSNANGTLGGQEDLLPSAGDGWFNNQYEHAFQLAGVSGVPEPATFALFGVGLTAIGLWRRRKALVPDRNRV